MQPRERLTVKEMQVAALVWEGQTNREIAKAIGTTEQVVKNYLRNTFDKLGVWTASSWPFMLLDMAASAGGRSSRYPRLIFCPGQLLLDLPTPTLFRKMREKRVGHPSPQVGFLMRAERLAGEKTAKPCILASAFYSCHPVSN
jgi:hypothetical protein